MDTAPACPIMMSTGSPGVKRMKKKTTMATPNMMGMVAKIRSKTLTARMFVSLQNYFSINKFPKSSTCKRQPGPTSVVASFSWMITGPSTMWPARSAARSNTLHCSGPAENQTDWLPRNATSAGRDAASMGDGSGFANRFTANNRRFTTWIVSPGAP